MTAIRWAIMPAEASVAPRCLPCDPCLAQRRQRESAVENGKAVALDFVEQGAIDRGHDQPGTLRPAIDRRQRGERLFVELAGALHLKGHQCLEARSHALLEQLGARHLESGHFVLWQIDAAAPRILADIANAVGELEGDPEIARVN